MIMYKKEQSWILHTKYIHWRARKPNYQRRVKGVLQGVRMSTASNTSGQAASDSITAKSTAKINYES